MNKEKIKFRAFETEVSWRVGLDSSRKEEGLAEIALAVQKKKIRYYPSFVDCMLQQMKYQTLENRLLQGGILIMALALSVALRKFRVEDTTAIVLCSAFMAFAANICMCAVGSLFFRNMAELEQTLYFNLKQMVCIQILQAGMTDVLILALLTILCGGQNIAGAGAYLLYLLVPFLWSDILYLHMLTSLRGKGRGRRSGRHLEGRSGRGMQSEMQENMGGVALGLVCGMAAVFPVFLGNVYEAAYLPVWGLAALAGFIALVMEIRRLLGKIEGGEGLCLS